MTARITLPSMISLRNSPIRRQVTLRIHAKVAPV